MNNTTVLSDIRDRYLNLIEEQIEHSNIESQFFCFFILGTDLADEIGFVPSWDLQNGDYAGYPEISALGYSIYMGQSQSINLFIDGLKRLSMRSPEGLLDLVADDVALFGLALGLSTLGDEYQDLKEWLSKKINEKNHPEIWCYRIRQMAGDLLDHKGRMSLQLSNNSLDTQLLDLLILQPEVINTNYYEDQTRKSKNLFLKLINTKVDSNLDVEKASTRLRAIDLLERRIVDQFGDYKFQLAIDIIGSVKLKLDKKIKRRKLRKLSLWVVFFITFLFIIGHLINLVGWEKVEIGITLAGFSVTFIIYIASAIINSEFNPIELLKLSNQKTKNAVYRCFGFDQEKYIELQEKRIF